MAKRIKQNLKNNQSGFTLIEVMIALMIFSIFITAIMVTQSGNVSNSMNMTEDLILHNLAEMKMNEILIEEREFTNATETDVESKQFEEEGYTDYKYTIKFTKIEFPNFEKIQGKEEGDNSGSDPVQKELFKKLKINLEKLLWQITVTVVNIENPESKYSLNGWITNTKAQIATDSPIEE